VQPFDAGHLFGFLGDLDAVADEYQATVDLDWDASLQHNLPPLAHDRTELPGPGPEERQHLVYSEGRIASQRTKELAPQWSMRTMKPITTVTNQWYAAWRVKQGRKASRMRLI